MAQVLIRNIDDAVMARLRARARHRGVPLERELRDVLSAAVHGDRATFKDEAERLRRRLAGRRHTDSARLLRQDRGR